MGARVEIAKKLRAANLRVLFVHFQSCLIAPFAPLVSRKSTPMRKRRKEAGNGWTVIYDMRHKKLSPAACPPRTSKAKRFTP